MFRGGVITWKDLRGEDINDILLPKEVLKESEHYKVYSDRPELSVQQPNKVGMGAIRLGDRVGAKPLNYPNQVPQFFPRKNVLKIPSSASTLGNIGQHNIKGNGVNTLSRMPEPKRNNIRLVL
jgi:hypothetical protein